MKIFFLIHVFHKLFQMPIVELNGQEAFAKLSGRPSFAKEYKDAVREMLKVSTYEQLLKTPVPEWYLLKEIPWEKFIACNNVKKIYNIREGKVCKSLSLNDPFLRACYPDDTDEEFMARMVAATKPRQYVQVIGDLHTEVAGLIPGYLDVKTVETRRKLNPEAYPKDFMLGCDLLNETRTEIYEFKNNAHTMNSDAAKSVKEKLNKASTKGFMAYLVKVCADAWN
jgi:hypothetical protein